MTTDFKDILKRELEERLNHNSRYSLRAFARDLKMAPALLSDVLNGKRGLSRTSASRLAKRLGFNPRETEHFCDLVESLHARSQAIRTQAEQRIARRAKSACDGEFLRIESEWFHFVADWHHFAILELMKLSAYREDFAWIAKRLGIAELQVTRAFERMAKLKIIRETDDGFRPVSDTVSTPDGVPSSALKQHHEQFLKLALQALYTQSVEERDFRALTIKCRKESVPRVREKMKRFLLELDAELSSDRNADEVYELSTQFFRLTHVPHLTSQGV